MSEIKTKQPKTTIDDTAVHAMSLIYDDEIK